MIAIGISIPARKAMKVQPAEALHDEWQIGTYKTGNKVRQVQDQQLFGLITHRSRS